QAEKIFRIGFEKIIINSLIIKNINILENFIKTFGKQAIIVSLDFRKNFFGKYTVYSNSGNHNTKITLQNYVSKVARIGCGEILLNDIDREGTWKGLNIELTKQITQRLDIPIIIHGGACSNEDVIKAFHHSGASAVGVGNMVVYQKKDMGVLINYSKLF
ncbi:HisA/HisF-related TIM barrel protein, partial [Alphaproteobacteria bacterium]|nr:HisA/HisF-related TIM barrel protein [Alphaproteobacteria bacterium]